MDIVVLIAPSDSALMALANVNGDVIICKSQFDTLGSVADPALGDVGALNVQQAGWVAIAQRS
jgi:hypothetical protein